MLIKPNYAKNYASTIGKGLQGGSIAIYAEKREGLSDACKLQDAFIFVISVEARNIFLLWTICRCREGDLGEDEPRHFHLQVVV